MRLYHYLECNMHVETSGYLGTAYVTWPGINERLLCGQKQSKRVNWTSNRDMVTCKKCKAKLKGVKNG